MAPLCTTVGPFCLYGLTLLYLSFKGGGKFLLKLPLDYESGLLDYFYVYVTLASGFFKGGEDLMIDEEELVEESKKYESMLQIDVPKGRDGKHKQIISQLLEAIGELGVGAALKIPLAELPDTKQNIRSALSRAASQKKINLATSSSNEFLYVWKTDNEDKV